MLKELWILCAECILFLAVEMKETAMVKVTLEQATKTLGGVEM